VSSALQLQDIRVNGISELDSVTIQAACAAGTPCKLVRRAERVQDHIVASAGAEKVPPSDPIGCLGSEALRNLTLIEGEAGLETTTYGLLTEPQ